MTKNDERGFLYRGECVCGRTVTRTMLRAWDPHGEDFFGVECACGEVTIAYPVDEAEAA